MTEPDRCDLLCLDLPRAEAVRAARPGAAAVAAARRSGPARSPTRRGCWSPPPSATASELCVCDLAWVAGRSDRLVSHHVRALRAAGLAASRREGKMVMYRLTGDGRRLLDAVLPTRRDGVTTVLAPLRRGATTGASGSPPGPAAVLAQPGRHDGRGCHRHRGGHRRGVGRAGRLRHRLGHRGPRLGLISGASAAAASGSDAAERRAQQLVAAQFFLLAPYVALARCGRSPGAATPRRAGSASAWRRRAWWSCRTSGTPRQRARRAARLAGDPGRGAPEHALRVPRGGAARSACWGTRSWARGGSTPPSAC